MIWYYNEIKSETLNLDKIPILPGRPILLLSELDSIHCFINPEYTDDKQIISIKGMPSLRNDISLAKLTNNKHLKGLLELRHGTLYLTNPKEMFKCHNKYKSIECNLQYTGHIEQYKVVVPSFYPSQLNTALTRQLFGLTSMEIKTLLGYLQNTLYHSNSGFGQNAVPQLARSPKVNTCDISGMIIPASFPYITFAPSGEPYSHISLYSFYQFARFLPTINGLQETLNEDSELEGILHLLSTMECDRYERTLATQSLFA